jgi:hypothetical protein
VVNSTVVSESLHEIRKALNIAEEKYQLLLSRLPTLKTSLEILKKDMEQKVSQGVALAALEMQYNKNP